MIHKLEAPETGHFVAPALFKVQSIAALDREIFGPVLHLATFKAEHLDQTVDAINARGYGLTLGMHSRVDRRIEQVVSRAHVGNIYINRNQIGAVVGSQPFGGEGLSGTGPKAGGPHYLARFLAEPTAQRTAEAGASQGLSGEPASAKALGNVIETVRGVLAGFGPNDRPRDHIPAFLKRLPEAEATRLSDALDGWPGIGLTTADLPGPTGESNRLGLHPRGVFLCLGRLAPDGLAEDGVVTAIAQALRAAALGNAAVIAAPSAGRHGGRFPRRRPARRLSRQDGAGGLGQRRRGYRRHLRGRASRSPAPAAPGACHAWRAHSAAGRRRHDGRRHAGALPA